MASFDSYVSERSAHFLLYQISEKMKQTGMSKRMLSKRIGIPYSTLCRHLNRIESMPIGMLAEIADGIGLEISLI